VYLWGINLSIAVPVAIVTGSATIVYAGATVVPFIDRFCPYSTPAHKMLAATFIAVTRVRRNAFAAANSLYHHTNEPEWLEYILEKIRDILEPTAHQTSEGSSATDQGVPMDIVTSQMLSWLIVNCEDSRSIDTALQAIAGATHDLPQEPLVECGVGTMLLQRLDSCSQWDQTSRQYRLRDPSLLPSVLKHLRACIMLVSGDTHSVLQDRWNSYRLLRPELRLNAPGSQIPDICSMWVVRVGSI
jgi:hypothetical protein